MIIDSHAHYNLDPFFSDWKMYWEKAQQSGIGASIIPGADIDTSNKAVYIAQQDKNLYAEVGIHPHEAIHILNNSSLLATWKQELEKLSMQEKVVGIGECGLDYFKYNDVISMQEKNAQKRLFGMQIQLAKEVNKPLSIHARDAYDDILDTLNHFSKNDGKYPRGVLHCISGNTNYLNTALEIGLYIGVAGNVTYKNAQIIRDLVLNTPTDRILVETDMPYLPPASKRGQTNNPEYIVETVQYLSELLHIEKEKLEDMIQQNTRRLFTL